MAKRKIKKVSNILDSYIQFKDMDEEEFRNTFGGAKDTIINSWLYLLYNDLKDQFETPDEEVEDEPAAVDLAEEEKKRKRREARRKAKMRKEEKAAKEEGSDPVEETGTDIVLPDEEPSE